MKAVVKFARLTRDERALLVDAALLLAGIRIALWLLPYSALRDLLQTGRQGSAGKSGIATPQRLAWAVRVASRFVPAATCLTQSLALHRLLARSGYASRVQIGVAKENGRFQAHAWVEHRGKVLLDTPRKVAG